MNTTELPPDHQPAPAFTPGPYTPYGDTCIAKNGELIAEVLRGGSRQLPIQSNRKLFLAAPELYAALRDLIEAVDLCTPDAPEPVPGSVMAVARAALTSAV